MWRIKSSKFSAGALVRVAPKRRFGRPDSEGGVAFVEKIAGSPSSPQALSLQYVISRRTSPNVTPERVRPAIIATTARKRQGDTTIKPSLLSYCPVRPTKKHRTEVSSSALSAGPSTGQTLRPDKVMDTSALVSVAKEYNPSYPGVDRAIDILLRKKSTCKAGWLRELHKNDHPPEAGKRTAPNGTGHLKAYERQLVYTLGGVLDLNRDGVYSAIGYAWNVDPKTVKNIMSKSFAGGKLSFERQKRSDAGATILTSAEKCKKLFTPEAVFRKVMRENAPAGECLSGEELKAAWAALPEREKERYNDESSEWLDRAPHLVSSITDVLHQTRGLISWDRLTAEIAGGKPPLVCSDTIRNFVMSMPGSSYVKTQMHPKVDESCKFRRNFWADAFYAFWDGAEECAEEVLVLLAHMDEKWFDGLPTRTNIKDAPGLGVRAVQHSVHHKKHIPKQMFLCSTGFLPHQNNMTRGGRAFKINFERAGQLIAALKDSFRRVYEDDGSSYTYPRELENRLRQMGELYFKCMEVTGSNEGTAKNPKYSLLRFFLDIEIPALELIVSEIERETGKKVVVRYQMDGAGPHKDKTLLSHLNAEFDKRGWMLRFQPANSPLTNVKDACIFPSLSKRVSALQGLRKKSLMVEGEELYGLAKAAWDELPLETIARSYALHHQVVNAIAQCKGGDDFVREKGALSCGIRKAYGPYHADGDSSNSEPCGVQLSSDFDPRDGEGNDRAAPTLKYPKPDTSEHGGMYHKLLSYQELNFLEKYLPRDSRRLEDVRAALLLKEWGIEDADDAA